MTLKRLLASFALSLAILAAGAVAVNNMWAKPGTAASVCGGAGPTDPLR